MIMIFFISEVGQDILEVEMCLDDNQEIETATVLTEAERMFECSAVSPACLREGFTHTRVQGRDLYF